MFPVVVAEEAVGGEPLLAFALDEFADAVLLDVFQVLDLAHAVPRPAALVEVAKPVAGELRAMAAKFVGALLADAEEAADARHPHVLLGLPAAVAGVFLAQVHFADAAVYAARGDEGCCDSLFH